MYTASKPLSLEILKKMAEEELLIPQVNKDDTKEVILRFLYITRHNLEMLIRENQDIYNSIKVGIRLVIENEEDNTTEMESVEEFIVNFNVEKDIWVTGIESNAPSLIIVVRNKNYKTTTEIDIKLITGIQLLIEDDRLQ